MPARNFWPRYSISFDDENNDNYDNHDIDTTSHANNSDHDDTHTVDGYIETSEFVNLIPSKIAIEYSSLHTVIKQYKQWW